MRLRRLEVENFRGIAKLDWRGVGDTSALVGPGDSCKSTVLEAIERVLSPRWNLTFDDADFYNLDTKLQIQIRATISDLPKPFFADSKFGLVLCALSPDSTTTAPIKETQPDAIALVIELRVDATLEPTWVTIDSEGREQPISAKDREALGMIRVGTYVDSHLGWSRGSVLARLTGRGDAISGVLADASRQARKGISLDGLDKLKTAAASVQTAGATLGVSSELGFGPHLDVGALAMGAGALALHEGEVPLRRAGLGTRRLLAMAMQKDAGTKDGLALVDEIENGLEPYRIRRLLRVLRGKPPEAKDGAAGQFILTTHSPVVLSELEPKEVCVVRRERSTGVVTITTTPTALATVLSKAPEALLGRRIVVGEGITEVGFVLAYGDVWEERGEPSLAYRGVEVVNGLGGSQPAKIAGALALLGYTTGLLIDSDGDDKKSLAQGAQIFQWEGGVSIEERIALDLPDEAVREMARMASQSRKGGGLAAVRACLADALKLKKEELGDDPEAWLDEVGAGRNGEFRRALGARAKSKGWFKTKDLGADLAQLVAKHEDVMVFDPVADVLTALKNFVHGA